MLVLWEVFDFFFLCVYSIKEKKDKGVDPKILNLGLGNFFKKGLNKASPNKELYIGSYLSYKNYNVKILNLN
jgi:hypothetical protein